MPSGHDVITVTLLGTLGGLLAAILAIKNMHGTASPYNVPQALALLKLPLGAVSAIGALIAIRGDFIPGFSNLDSQAQILAYAFGFGLAQQLLTGLVDKQARSILSTAPGKATGRTRPERQVPRPAVPSRRGPSLRSPFGPEPVRPDARHRHRRHRADAGIDAALGPDDGVRVFNTVYLAVTEHIAASLQQGGHFRDDAAMTDLDVRFAGLWLGAYDAAAGDRAVPTAWDRCSPAVTRPGCCPSSSRSPG